MGYFDALADDSFKKGSDGRWLFFPARLLARGYIIDSEQAYQTLRRRVAVATVAGPALLVGAFALLGLTAGLIVAALYVPAYLLWARYQVRALQPSAERLSWDETMSSQAIARSAVSLWLGFIGSLVFVVSAIRFLIEDPRYWLIMLTTIFVFGMFAVAAAHALIWQRRNKASAAPRRHDSAR